MCKSSGPERHGSVETPKADCNKISGQVPKFRLYVPHGRRMKPVQPHTLLASGSASFLRPTFIPLPGLQVASRRFECVRPVLARFGECAQQV